MLRLRGKLLELKSIDFDMCESCILGKQKNVSLKTGRTLMAEKLELVYTDLGGGGGLLWLHPVEVQGTTSLSLMTQV